MELRSLSKTRYEVLKLVKVSLYGFVTKEERMRAISLSSVTASLYVGHRPGINEAT